jgi:chemotaxis protein histidine kinase CheA
MDVVKRGIESLRGAVEIDSVPGQGTEITVRLPLTLAIIDGLQVQTGQEFFVAPLSIVEECVDLPRTDRLRRGPHRQSSRGDRPYIRLRDFFSIDGRPPDVEQVVVSCVEGSRVGIVVDRVIGEHQTVIKSLGVFIGTWKAVRGDHQGWTEPWPSSSTCPDSCARRSNPETERGGADMSPTIFPSMTTNI